MRVRRLSIATLIVTVGAATWALTRPAQAHTSGGRAQIYVASVRLEPQPEGWRIGALLRDADSGQAEPGFGVEASGSGWPGGTFGPVSLADPDADGRYEAVVPLTEGDWSITLKAGEIPGGDRALPYTRTWRLTLEAGQAVDLAGRPTGGATGGGGSGAIPLVLGGLGAAAALGVGRWWLARRRFGGIPSESRRYRRA